MRKTPILLLAAAATLLPAQPIPESDREFALSALHADRKAVLDSVTGLSAAQWKFKPAPDRWSIAEIAEHITLTEDWIFERINEMLKAPPVPPRPSDRQRDQALMEQTADRTAKRQAPKGIIPTGRWATPADFVREFKQRRERTLDFIRTTQAPLRSHIADFGDSSWDAYQWLLGLAAHADRHVAQIKEVKADPAWPR